MKFILIRVLGLHLLAYIFVTAAGQENATEMEPVTTGEPDNKPGNQSTATDNNTNATKESGQQMEQTSEADPTNLRVSLVVDRPYIYKNDCQNASTVEEETNCFQGLLIQLLTTITEELDLTFTIVSQEPSYGVLNPKSGEWDGVVGQLVKRNVDIGLAAFTVNAEREEVIDFTRSFTINVKGTNLSVSYALGLAKGSPFTTPVSKLVYKLGYWGKIKDMEDYWWDFDEKINQGKWLGSLEH